MVEVQALESADDAEAWDAFVEGHPEGGYYHLAGWRDVLARSLGYRTLYLRVIEEGRTLSVLPLAYFDRLPFNRSVHSLPVLVLGGVVEARLLHCYVEYLRKHERFRTLRLKQLGPLVADSPPSYSREFRIDLSRGIESVLSGFHKGKRRSVRRGSEADYRLEHGRDGRTIEAFYRLYVDRMYRFGTPPLPRSFFTLASEVFGDRFHVFLVSDGQGLLGASVCFGFKTVFSSLFAVMDGRQDEETHKHLAVYFEYQKMIHAAREGFAIYSIGRSPADSTHVTTKREYGTFELEIYDYLYRLDDGSVDTAKPSQERFAVFGRIWRHLPRPLVLHLGPLARKIMS